HHQHRRARLPPRSRRPSRKDERAMSVKTYHGSCHCGAVRFEADLDLATGVNKCNCTYCSKARSWFKAAAPGDVRLLEGAEAMTQSQWAPPGKTPTLTYQFCRRCGVRTFGLGGDQFRFVNLAALDDAPVDELAAAPLNIVDGRHDRFDRRPE